MKHLRVTIQGKVYEVTVESLDQGGLPASATPPPVAAASVAASPSSASATAVSTGAPGEVPSPLSGKVVAIQVTPGHAVKQGDELIVLEAMKMNTYIYAPKDGTVAEVLTNVGDAVAEGQVVIRIA